MSQFTSNQLVCQFAVVLSVVVGVPPQAAHEAHFRFSRELSFPPIESDELVAVDLDEAIYESTDDQFNDLRILNQQDTPVPFLLKRERTRKTRSHRQTWAAKSPTVRPTAEGGLEIEVTLAPNQPAPDGMRIVTPLRNFEQRVRIYTSDDAANWTPIGTDEVLFDYSRYMDVRSDTVKLPKSTGRNFRIVIDKVTSKQESRLLELTRRLRGDAETEREEKVTVDRRPFRISRIEFWKEVRESNYSDDRMQTYPTAGIRIEQRPETKQTWIFVETARTPLTFFELETSTKNFSRRVSIDVEEGSDEESHWRNLSSSTLSRIDFRDLSRERLGMRIDESRHDTYRISIDNRDSPPLEITGVRTEGPIYQALFLVPPGESYRLVYSADEVDSPKYDTVAINQVLNTGFVPLKAELQKPTELARPTIPSESYNPLRDSKVLIGAIVLLVVVLGVSLYSALRRLNDLDMKTAG